MLLGCLQLLSESFTLYCKFHEEQMFFREHVVIYKGVFFCYYEPG
jgi:hypothetical protein